MKLSQDPSNIPIFLIAFTVVGIFIFRTIRIFLQEGVIQHIKDDWTYRFPQRIHHNRYRGASRFCYIILCFLFYPIKAFFLLVLAFEIYTIKFVVWDIWKWLLDFCTQKQPSQKEDAPVDIVSASVGKISASQAPCATAEHPSAISQLWHSGSEQMWKTALQAYWNRFNDEQYRLEKEIEAIEANYIANFTVYEFYDFLYQQYFPWKFTNNLFLARNRKHLETYLLANEINRLEQIQSRLFALNFENIKDCLAVASSIRGLGVAGASGLLSILYPEHFGTVDQFVVFALLQIDDLAEASIISGMNPESLTLNNGVVLTQILRNKSQELNTRFHTDFWTPRKIDMVLWASR